MVNKTAYLLAKDAESTRERCKTDGSTVQVTVQEKTAFLKS